MNTNRSNSAEDVLRRFAKLAEPLSLTLKTLSEKWAPQEAPAYIVMAAFADKFVSSNMLSQAEKMAVLNETENAIKLGGAGADLATVGFLEALLARASSGCFDFAEVVAEVGVESLSYCRAWDSFTGCRTVDDAQQNLASRSKRK